MSNSKTQPNTPDRSGGGEYTPLFSPEPAGGVHAPNQAYGLNTTNLYTHGLHVSPQSPADDVLKQIKPTESFDFAFDIDPKHPPGTRW